MKRTEEHESTRETDGRTMGEISHANPYTGETVGKLFNRGPIVAADGGKPNATPDADDEDAKRTMKHVSHTPPNDSEDANRVFERGRVRSGDDE